MSTTAGVVLRPSGDLDREGCAVLRRGLSAALAAGARHVVLDFSEVGHLELEAVQLLRGVQRFLHDRGGGLVVSNPSTAALSGLRVNDLTDLLSIEDIPLKRPLRSVG